MSNTSPRLALPFLATGQAQKEITHNEALALLDGLAHGALQSRTLTTPPASPLPGQLWLVPSGATGDWQGQSGKLALASDGGWRFVTPVAGLCLWSIPDQSYAGFDGSQWRWGDWPVQRVMVAGQPVVGARQSAIADPSGGTTVDSQARAAVQSILTALRTHGLIA
jgi:hypothetical protein